MPTYDYRCDACSHELEIFQSITEAAKRKCPACGGLKLKRVIGSGAGIIFRGSGFYETDYRSESYKKGADADQSAAKSTSSDSDSAPKSKPEGKPESKPEKKSDSKPAGD